MLHVHRVVIPVDFSEAAMLALDTARAMVPSDRGMHVVYVIDHLTSLNPLAVMGSSTDEEREETARIALGAQLEKRGFPDARVHVTACVGNPAAAIADYAAAIDADMIVIPSHGRTGLARLALGSVAQRVVRLAKCAVLVVKRQEPVSVPPDDIP